MAACKIHGDKMLRDEGTVYCQLCFDAAKDDQLSCDYPQCECSFDCERMVRHQQFVSTENVI